MCNGLGKNCILFLTSCTVNFNIYHKQFLGSRLNMEFFFMKTVSFLLISIHILSSKTVPDIIINISQ